MRKTYLLIILCLFTFSLFGQPGYFLTDSTKSSGVFLILGGIENTYFCEVKQGNGSIKYTPSEINEYGFENGPVYKSFDITIDSKQQRYFFEQLVSGDICLYYLSLKGGIKKYYLTSGDHLLLEEIPRKKEAYQTLFKKYVVNCPQATRNLQYLRLSRSNAVRFLNDFNNCADRPFPKIHYGLKVGGAFTQTYYTNSQSSLSEKINDLNFMAGVFMDIPIMTSNLSVSPEVYYSKSHLSKSFDRISHSFDLNIDYSSITIPLFLRYSFLNNKLTPYIQAGPIYSRIIKSSNILYEYDFNGNDINMNLTDSSFLQENMGGFSIGSGIVSNYGSRFGWFGEIRYSQLFNLYPSPQYINVCDFTFSVGLIF
jgi:hypothetical protein